MGKRKCNGVHGEKTLACSCGYVKEGWAPPLTTRVRWERVDVEREWRHWTSRERQVYLYARELALEATEDRLLAARVAAEEVLKLRVREGSGIPADSFIDFTTEPDSLVEQVQLFELSPAAEASGTSAPQHSEESAPAKKRGKPRTKRGGGR